MKPVLLDYWCWRIAKSMKLKKPVKLHVVGDNVGLKKYTAEEYEAGMPVFFPVSTLGNFYIPFQPSKYHHIFLRRQPTPMRNLYVLGHELRHAWQNDYDVENPREFSVTYTRENIARGYVDNRFEVDAREQGVKWVERIMRTGPMELFDPYGSLLVSEGSSISGMEKKFLEPELDKYKYVPKPLPKPFKPFKPLSFPLFEFPDETEKDKLKGEFKMQFAFDFSDEKIHRQLSENLSKATDERIRSLVTQKTLSNESVLDQAKNITIKSRQVADEEAYET